MANKPLLRVGPFLGVNLSTDPYYLRDSQIGQFGEIRLQEPGMGAQASNVDISYRMGAFTVARGRTVLGSLTLPAGTWTVQGLAQFNTFYGDNPLVAKRLYVFSALNGTASYQGYFDPSTGTTTQLPNASPFTQAIQFGASLWTNGGDRIFYLSGVLGSDVWQIAVPYQYAYNVFGTYAVTAGNAPVDTYTYAITLRKAQNPWQIVLGTFGIKYGVAGQQTFFPDLESLQESSPVFSTNVTVASGQQPGFYVPSGLGLTSLISGLTIGGQQYYGCLYRSRSLNPSFIFVDYLQNLVQMNDYAGNAAIIDTYADSATNAYLTIHHDTPPMIGQTYPGAIANNSGASQLWQQQQQVAFTYKNPAFITKHKGRVWCFTAYPAQPVGASLQAIPDEITLQPQVWCSDYGVPWSFNGDPAQNQVLLVGPECAPGNGSIDAAIATNPPWAPGLLENTPMGLCSTGSYLALFMSARVYIVAGDTPSEFIVQPAFDIGCLSTLSITEAEGGVFWLAPQGIYFFNGGTPQYLSEAVRGFIESVPWAQQQQAVGAYRDRTFYLSFPQQNVTLAYYLPARKWYTLPYGGTLAVSSPYNANSLVMLSGVELQQIAASATTDLGSPIVATWESDISDSTAPGQLKAYNFLQITAAVMPGTATVTLTLDASAEISNTFSATFDLSTGNGAHVVSLPAAMRGYEAQIKVMATTNAAATAPLSIRAVSVLGEISDAMRAPQTTDVTVMTLNGAQVYP